MASNGKFQRIGRPYAANAMEHQTRAGLLATAAKNSVDTTFFGSTIRHRF
jgi:hypothetical protein